MMLHNIKPSDSYKPKKVRNEASGWHTMLYKKALMLDLQELADIVNIADEDILRSIAEELSNTCSYCDIEFDDEYKLYNHVQSEHKLEAEDIKILDDIILVEENYKKRKYKIDNEKAAYKISKITEGIGEPIITADGDRYYQYSDGKYKEVSEQYISSLIGDMLDDVIADNGLNYIVKYSKNKIGEILDIIKRNTYKGNILNDSRYINCKNGMLDLDTLELKEHHPKYFSTIQINANYIEDDKELKVKQSEIIRFLISIVPDGYERSKLLEALALVFLQEYQYALMLVGKGANGKSTLLALYETMLGRDNVSHISIHDLEYNRFAPAELDNKIANIFADIKRLELTSTSNLKALISKDPIKVERKFGQPFTLYPKAYLIFSCNELPEVSEQTDAWFRRWIMIEFKQQFYSNARVDILKQLTKQENLDILFSILARIAHRIKKEGLKHEDNIEELKQRWVNKVGVIEQFISKHYEITNNSNDIIKKHELYQRYIDYCNANDIKYKLTDKQFTIRLKSLYGLTDQPRKISGKSVRVWLGIKLKDATTITTISSNSLTHSNNFTNTNNNKNHTNNTKNNDEIIPIHLIFHNEGLDRKAEEAKQARSNRSLVNNLEITNAKELSESNNDNFPDFHSLDIKPDLDEILDYYIPKYYDEIITQDSKYIDELSEPLKDKVKLVLRNNKVSVKCLVCNDDYIYSFSSISQVERWYKVFHIIQHNKEDSKKYYTCNICNVIYRETIYYKNHMKWLHGIDIPNILEVSK
ncbi:MAG: hypothetical protein KatS3mg003_0934 [Candidatus Nitrosocaldaceae archaeon]|nr:MAG: hypothetical protein KatS3mg003_0934 [Candidatus Nitrosocaldaceae archaeon]